MQPLQLIPCSLYSLFHQFVEYNKCSMQHFYFNEFLHELTPSVTVNNEVFLFYNLVVAFKKGRVVLRKSVKILSMHSLRVQGVYLLNKLQLHVENIYTQLYIPYPHQFNIKLFISGSMGHVISRTVCDGKNRHDYKADF